MSTRSFLTIPAIIAASLSLFLTPGTADDTTTKSPLAVDNLHLMFAAPDADKVVEFYGNIVGLARMSDIDIPGGIKILRYLGGQSPSELKFLISEDLQKQSTKRGLVLVAFVLPDSQREGISDRLKEAGLKVPAYSQADTPNGTVRWGSTNDFDGNMVEFVFLPDQSDAESFKLIHVGLAASDQDVMDSFLANVLEMVPGDKVPVHRFQAGKTQVKHWKAAEGAEMPIVAQSGQSLSRIGIGVIQMLVQDVDAARERIVTNGGKVHTEPFELGTLAKIMFVEGPDGVLIEVAGPIK